MLSRRELLGGMGAVAASAMTRRPRSTYAQSLASEARMFPGFEVERVETAGAVIHTVIGGQGPPVLLLHGAPQSHFSWARVAPDLARDYTVVAADLRGYGDSSKPPGGENHIDYSKRTMARDQVEVMQHFGFEEFSLIGHDRGGRVGRRLALDHPDRVTRLAVLDIVPAHYLYANTTREFAQAYYHWFFFIRPEPFPETIINNNLELFVGRGNSDISAEYLRAFQNPATVHAMCEDYRASASIDIEIDEADLDAGKRITCPLRVLWGDRAPMGRLYDVLAIWQQEATNANGRPMPGGHSFHEQNPEETLMELREFLEV